MLAINNISFYFGSRPLYENASLHIKPKDRIGLIGANGTGKSTLLRLIVGEYTPDEGSISRSKECTIGFLNQDLLSYKSSKSILEVAQEAFEEQIALKVKIDHILHQLETEYTDDLVNELSELQERFETLGGYSIQSQAEEILEGLGFKTADLERPLQEFSGGWRMRVMLAKLLLQKPALLLLDEPTNHLDAESVQWLERHLQEYKGTVIAVTHDRYFLDNVAGWILELDRGEGIPWKGNYSSWLEQKQKRLAQEEKSETKRMKTLERELDWVKMAPKARQAKSKARLSAYEKMLSEEGKEKEAKLELYIPAGPRLGNKVIVAENLSKAYGDKLLFENLSFTLPPAGIVGIIGPNGAGKTTLFKLITGKEKPDTGTFEVGETVKVAYVDQEHDNLDPEKTVYQAISEGSEWVQLGNLQVNARAYVSKFNFTGNDQEKKIGVLSGGERNRVHLAMTLKEGGNLLLLDEPTNDLDVNTLRALEEALENFGGCAVIISHDRWFLDRLCTHILAFEGDSQVYFFEGNYSDYEENKKKRLGNEAPKRIKYKKLM
ncbi:MAG: energy-dependent translational throttle protein EttA [Microscillaceae bacterium]|nr:energy-dependent translational throttle protein EttA [Microscillaceae bacterium]